ncbi:MAG: response regulator [Gammaproteobacteria bacterium]|jgi:CheY-like chemotaxis protein|nr:response regulator [Gammaproteobacteria bacterium]MBT4492913.1 response regulator [Gammaproteobacteria bacterium]
MSGFSSQLQNAPIALIAIGDDDVIVDANLQAIEAGLTVGESMKKYQPDLGAPFREAVEHQRDTESWLFRFDDSEKRYRITSITNDTILYCWLQDLSEQVALAEKVKQLKDPGSKRLRRINHQATTALGYAELLEVIMDDHEMLTAEKLSAVKQYQSEVANSLKMIQQIAQQEKEGKAVASSSILVAESHEALSELITELLRAEGYRVACFSDGQSALKYYSVNREAISKAIIDENLKGEGNLPLVMALRDMAPDLEIVTLTADASASSRDRILKPVDFQLLLKAVED